LFWYLEFWSGSFFDTALNSDTAIAITDAARRGLGMSPTSAVWLITGIAVLVIGGAAYFSAGYFAAAITRSIVRRFRSDGSTGTRGQAVAKS
jgi:hypothetical protein